MNKELYETKRNMFISLANAYFDYLSLVEKSDICIKLDFGNFHIEEIESLLVSISEDVRAVSMLVDMFEEGTLFLYADNQEDRRIQIDYPCDLFDYLMKEKGE